MVSEQKQRSPVKERKQNTMKSVSIKKMNLPEKKPSAVTPQAFQSEGQSLINQLKTQLAQLKSEPIKPSQAKEPVKPSPEKDAGEPIKCPMCNGSGCDNCDNKGYIDADEACEHCHGKGHIHAQQVKQARQIQSQYDKAKHAEHTANQAKYAYAEKMAKERDVLKKAARVIFQSEANNTEYDGVKYRKDRAAGYDPKVKQVSFEQEKGPAVGSVTTGQPVKKEQWYRLVNGGYYVMFHNSGVIARRITGLGYNWLTDGGSDLSFERFQDIINMKPTYLELMIQYQNKPFGQTGYLDTPQEEYQDMLACNEKIGEAIPVW